MCWANTTQSQCVTLKGGLYDPDLSTSAEGSLTVFEAGGDPSDQAGNNIGPHIWFNEFAKDTLHVNGTSLEEFPIGMSGLDFGGRFDSQANIGLGQNSTFLQALKDGGHISSRTWSYWAGINSATSSAARDGQIVFGGYDAAKASGPNITQPLAAPSKGCPSGMSMIVTTMRLDFPNGTQSDLLSPGTFSACFQPDFPFVMTAPYDPYYERFMNDTGTVPDNRSLGIHWFGPLFDPRNM